MLIRCRGIDEYAYTGGDEDAVVSAGNGSWVIKKKEGVDDDGGAAGCGDAHAVGSAWDNAGDADVDVSDGDGFP